MLRAEALVNAGVDAIIIDTAHGHTQGVVTVLKEVKAKFPQIDVVVGNIATPEAARYLVDNGADAVKVGIGPGSICTTRVVAGVGFPQFSAVLEVAVVGAPSAQWGEEVVAFVVLRPGAEAPAEELDRWCRAEIAAFKTPKRYCFRAELPKSNVGKILRRELRDPRPVEQAASA